MVFFQWLYNFCISLGPLLLRIGTWFGRIGPWLYAFLKSWKSWVLSGAWIAKALLFYFVLVFLNFLIPFIFFKFQSVFAPWFLSMMAPMVDQSFPQSTFQFSGLAAWFIYHLRGHEAFIVIVSAVASKFVMRIMVRVLSAPAQMRMPGF